MTVGLVRSALRLHRAQILVTAALLALLVVGSAVHGSLTSSFIDADRAGSCLPPDCEPLAVEVAARFRWFEQAMPVLALAPAAIGAFWGAPLLAREFETGTAKFAWTQSVTRRDWILSRVVVLGSLLVVGGLVLGAAVSSWLSVFDGFELPGVTAGDLSFGQMRGVAPAGWWLFGFSLGVVSGALLRRTMPAMVVTAVVTVAATIGRNLWIAQATQAIPAPDPLRLAQTEIVALVAASVLMIALTMWSVDRARV